MKDSISYNKCQKRLATLWYVFTSVLFIILILQSVFNKFGPNAEEAWSWLLSSIMPAVSLITSVIVYNATHKIYESRSVERYVFRLAFVSSLFYLILVFSTFFSSPSADMTF